MAWTEVTGIVVEYNQVAGNDVDYTEIYTAPVSIYNLVYYGSAIYGEVGSTTPIYTPEGALSTSWSEVV